MLVFRFSKHEWLSTAGKFPSHSPLPLSILPLAYADDGAHPYMSSTSLHIVAGQLHHGRSRLRGDLGGIALHGLGHQVLGLVLGLLLDAFLHQLDLLGEVAGELFLDLFFSTRP